MTTNKDRQAQFRARMREKGYVLLREWVHPADAEKLRKEAEKLRRARGHDG